MMQEFTNLAATVRGSTRGLKKNREETKAKNTESMWAVVNQLRKDKPTLLWTFKEVWKGAGLKSHVALASVWNAPIRNAIEQHNLSVNRDIEVGAIAQSQRKTLRESIRELMSKNESLKIERDSALAKIALFQSDADYYKKRHEELKRTNERLQKLVKPLSGI
jgi:hypothetical protein